MDVALVDLWLAILISAVVLFVAGFVLNMVLPHHKSDFAQAPDEKALLEQLRSSGVKRGQYFLPYCGDYKELKDPEKKKVYDAGPHGLLRILPGPPPMGSNLVKTFIWYLVVAVFVAYLAQISLQGGAGFLSVFRFTATAGVMAYCLGPLGEVIWFQPPPRVALNHFIDGAVYGLLTGVVFAFLWPEAAAIQLPVPG